MHFIFYVILLQIILFTVGAVLAHKNPSRNKEIELPKAVKAIISLSMVVTAFYAYSNYAYKAYSMYIFIGMIFSFFGDLLMCKLIDTKDNIVSGIIAFSGAHFSYVFAYINMINYYKLNIKLFITIAVLIFLIMIFLGYKLIVKRSKENPVRIVGVIVYAAIILNMFLFSSFLAIFCGNRWWLTFFSAIIFMTSDAIIAYVDIAKKPLNNSGLWIWATYITAQMGIICAAML